MEEENLEQPCVFLDSERDEQGCFSFEKFLQVSEAGCELPPDTCFAMSYEGSASIPDASVPDASVPDASVPDASVPDASITFDASSLDASLPDASFDASLPDASITFDASTLDASLPDVSVLSDALTGTEPAAVPLPPVISNRFTLKQTVERGADGGSEMEPEEVTNPLEKAQDTATQAQEVALTASKDIAPLLEAAPGGAGVAAALIAVAGGGAAFKFYSQWNKNKHEENMEKMRLESEKSQSDHTKCGIERATLVAQIEQLNGKIQELEDKNKALSLSMGDDLSDRLEKLEKQLAKVKKATKTIPAAKV
jgi:hypothetical protein